MSEHNKSYEPCEVLKESSLELHALTNRMGGGHEPRPLTGPSRCLICGSAVQSGINRESIHDASFANLVDWPSDHIFGRTAFIAICTINSNNDVIWQS